jgi:hypothetical protein
MLSLVITTSDYGDSVYSMRLCLQAMRKVFQETKQFDKKQCLLIGAKYV